MTADSNTSNSQMQSSTPPAMPAPQKPRDTLGTASAEKERPIVPQEIQDLLGKPPVLASEDPGQYKRLFELVVLAIGPSDILEYMWAKDITDNAWELARLQRLKGPLVEIQRKHALEVILRKLMEPGRTDSQKKVSDLSTGWFKDPKVKAEIEQLFTTMGLTEDSINAQALKDNCKDLLLLDKLIDNFTRRRSTAAQEIDRRRAEVIPPKRPINRIDEADGEAAQLSSDISKAN